MEPKPELFLAIALAIFFRCLALSFMYKKGKKSNFHDIKNESKADYLNRKADEQRKLNGQSKRW